LVRKYNIRLIVFLAALFLSLPFGWGKLSGLSNWISPFITLNSVLALKSFVLLNIIGFVVLIAAWFRKLFFCRYLCPVGCVLDWIPKRNAKKKGSGLKGVPAIGKWLAIVSLTGAVFGFPLFIFLDPMSIFNGFFSSFIQDSRISILIAGTGLLVLLLMQFVWPGLWCKRICPLGGLQFLISDLKVSVDTTKPATPKSDKGRRIFIGSAIGSAAALAFPFIVKGETDKIIRPPASLKPEDLYAMCTRCGSCIKACPTKIIKQDTRLGPGLLTPVVKFEEGYCLETCNACSVVCPSGAITLFDIDAKHQIVMGTADVNFPDCLLSHPKECAQCKLVCRYDAILITAGDNDSLMLPKVDPKKCVGCGACKIVCPTKCISI